MEFKAQKSSPPLISSEDDPYVSHNSINPLGPTKRATSLANREQQSRISMDDLVECLSHQRQKSLTAQK
jgi:hypothetical protein